MLQTIFILASLIGLAIMITAVLIGIIPKLNSNGAYKALQIGFVLFFAGGIANVALFIIKIIGGAV